MTNAPKANIETDLADFPVEVGPKTVATKKAEATKWDGTKTRIVLARPVIRDGWTTGPDEPCVDCRALGVEDRSHQFHIAASKGSDGEWHGPEAEHLRDLIGKVEIESGGEGYIRTRVSGGFIAGTAVHGEYVRERRRVAERVGPSDAGEKDLAGLRRDMRFELREDGSINPTIETSIRREESEQLRRAVREGFAEGIEPLAEAVRALAKQ